MNSGAEGAEKFFEHQNGHFFFPPNTWQMMTFLNPLDALIPKIPFSFFTDFWVWVTSEARGSVSVGFWGSRQLSPFLGTGGLARGLYLPPPPPIESPPAPDGHVGQVLLGLPSGGGGGGLPVHLALCRTLMRLL